MYTDNTELSLENNRFGCRELIELQKAFDTVKHDILLVNWNIVESEEAI